MFIENRHRIGMGTRFKVLLIAALIGPLPWAAGAAQGSVSQVDDNSVRVNYADLDISTPSGAKQLYGRIELAAAQLCPRVTFQELQRYAASLRCRNEVVARAVRGINSPQLAAVYASRTRHMARGPV